MDFAQLRANNGSMDGQRDAKSLGRFIREHREALKLSKSQAARDAGITEKWWRDVEAGEYRAGRDEADRVVFLPTRTGTDKIIAMCKVLDMGSAEIQRALVLGGHEEFAATWEPSEIASAAMLDDLAEAIQDGDLYVYDVRKLFDNLKKAARAHREAAEPTEQIDARAEGDTATPQARRAVGGAS